MKRTGLFLILLVLMIFSAACGTSSHQPTSGNENKRPGENIEHTIAPTAKTGQKEDEAEKLTLAIPAPTSLQPWDITDETTADFLSLIYEPLFVFTDEGKIQPVLAQTVTFADDASFVDVELKRDIYFHDGSLLDAGDVSYTIDQLRRKKNYYTDRISMISRTTIVDYYTIRLYFKRDSLSSVEGIVFPIGSETSTDPLIPIGTGPFMMDSSEDRHEIKLVPYEDFHGQKTGVSSIRCLLVKDRQAVYTAFSSGRSDLYHEDSLSWDQYQYQEKYTVYTYPSYEALYIAFYENGFTGVLSNRQKIAFAISGAEVLKDAAWGYGKASDIPFHPGYWYDPELEERYPKDSSKAAAIAVSGVPAGEVRVYADPEDQVAVKAAVSVVSQLEEAGMSAKIISSPDELYDLQIVHENVGLQRAFSLMGESERLDDLATEDELKEEVMNMAVYAQVKMPIYFLCYLDKGVVVSSHLSGRLSPGECFVYMGAEYLK